MQQRSWHSRRSSTDWRLVEVRYDLPDFRRRMLTAERRRSGNQIFAHRQSADDDGVETNLSDEARRDIKSVRVIASDRNPDEFALPVRVPEARERPWCGNNFVFWLERNNEILAIAPHSDLSSEFHVRRPQIGRAHV